MRICLAALAVGVVLSPTSAAAQSDSIWACIASQRWFCTPEDGCVSAPDTGIHAMVDFGASRYCRCEGEACDEYEMDVSVSGEFINLELPGRASFAKIGPNAEFTETVTLGQTVLLSYGVCEMVHGGSDR